ncbi:MAG TPA: acetate kinase [Candidatus Binatia bacterium]|nr:acetate kinase [Candidatus Binatia bacterium]
MNTAVLAVNAGSSSIKLSLFEIGKELRSTAAALHRTVEISPGQSHEDAFAGALAEIDRELPSLRIAAAGHRIVHGGTRFFEPVRIDPSVLAGLRELIPLAPLHQGRNIAAVEALERLHPGLPQVACFDTAFHHHQSAVATAVALPREITEKGVRGYGYHGLSYEYIASELPKHLGDAAEGRIVVAHLGNGASMCALRNRRSVATTMGFSALDGLVMGTRPGTLDPGVLLYLLERGMPPADLGDLLWNRSGLLGVSGVSGDMRTLLASPEPYAREAIELFVYRIVRELGSLAAALGGLDALVFTAGIGEHAPEIRARVCEGAAWLGLQSRIPVLVIPTDEEAVVARHTVGSLGLGP